MSREDIRRQARQQWQALQDSPQPVILVGTATCGRAAGAMEVLDPLLPHKPSTLARGDVRAGALLLARYIAMRTGSTGLWSIQVMLPNMLVGQAWKFITKKAGKNCLPAIGRDAQDTLRRQAGVPRPADFAGKDPISAGLARLVDLDHDFLGRNALECNRDKHR